MTQLGEQQTGRLAQASGRLLRSGRMVIGAITPKKEGGKQTSGSPITPPSPGQANFGASGQTSGPSVSPARVLLQQLQAALARAGRNGRTPEESVEPSSLTCQDITPVRPRRPEQARLSDVDLQAGASGQILQALHLMMQEVREHVEKLAQEVQQVRAEVKEGRAEMEK